MTEPDAHRMVELLHYANLSKVAKALGVSKTATSEWSRGIGVNAFRLRQVEDLLRPQSASAPPAANDELLREMRTIRRLLARQAGPNPEELVQMAVRIARETPAAATPKRSSGGARGRKAAEPAGASK